MTILMKGGNEGIGIPRFDRLPSTASRSGTEAGSNDEKKARICRENSLTGFLPSRNKSLYIILTNDSIF